MKANTIALLSGGLDSSVACQLAQQQGYEIVSALTFDYGQKSAAQEVEHASHIASYFGIRHQSYSLPWFSVFKNGGALLSGEQIPQLSTTDLENSATTRQSAHQVWVPNRNGVFIEVAAGIAEDLGAQHVLVGFNKEEAQTFPDNSQAYLEAINRALSFSTANHLEVIAPTIHFNKSEIVAKAKELSFPFSLLWSCYQNGSIMCGRCESCRRLKRALISQGVGYESFFTDLSL